MLHFFRKIRRDLIANSQFFKYLKYAIGEIVLVVLGILIALQINIWNEKRKSEEDTMLLFQAVDKELINNIQKVDARINAYSFLDPFYYRILNKQMNYEDYKQSRRPVEVNFYFGIVNPADDNLIKLLSSNKGFSKRQDSVVFKLKQFYSTEQKYLVKTDQDIINRTEKIREVIMKEVPSSWSDYRNKNIIDDEMINFCLSDPSYLSEIAEKNFIAYRVHLYSLLQFRRKALKFHEEISDLLNKQVDTTLFKNISDFEHYKGNFKFSDSKSNVVEVVIDGENEMTAKQFLNNIIHSEFLVHPMNDNLFITYQNNYFEENNSLFFDAPEPRLIRIEFDQNKEVLGLTIVGNMAEVEGERLIVKKIE